MLVGVWSLCVKCTSRAPLLQCVEYTLYYIMCTMVHIVLHYVHNGAPGQCGRDNAIAGGDTVSTLRKTHNDDEGDLPGNYMAITDKGTPFQELRFLTLYWT